MSSLGVFIGRFQPFHLGHQFIVQEALKKVDLLILVIGSSEASRSLKNPFSFEERRQLIQENLAFFLTPAEAARVHVIGVPDFPGDETWMKAVYEGIVPFLSHPIKKICILGYNKDESTYYLDLFKKFRDFEVFLLENFKAIDGTKIREIYFSPNQNGTDISPYLSPVTQDFLRAFKETPQWKKIMNGPKV